jgi:23S rRNA (guanosine2251-2'-O)-methyltransferase
MINPAPLLKEYLVKQKASRKAPSAYANENSNDDWRQKCGVKLKATELRTSEPSKEDLVKIKRRGIYFILDNILDTYNTGGIFRLADALGVKKIYLCGVTETPPNTRIKKASINTTEWVKWKYCETTTEAIKDLKAKVKNIQIVAIEQDNKSVPYAEIDYELPIAFVVGNETDGCSKETLRGCDQIVEIPMWGVNKSLNVIISLGIVTYHAVRNS